MNALAKTETPAAPPAVNMLEVISRAAADPAVNVEKLERLMALHERVTAQRAEAEFNASMQACQAEMPQIVRDAYNEQTKSKYARLETVSKLMAPVITKHGFALSYGTDVSPVENCHRVVCDVSHICGHTRRYFADVPADGVGMKGNANKTATHAFGSTLSYGRRYLKLMIFDVATTDDDGNAAGSNDDAISEDQLIELRDMIDHVEADLVKFCRFLGVTALADLPAKRFGAAMQALKDHGAKRRQEAPK